MTTSPADPVLVVSAMAEEIDPLGRRLKDARRERLGGLRVWRGSLAGREAVLAAAGEGPRLAARGVAGLLDATAPRALLGIGVAGGLTPDLDALDLVWSRRVQTVAGGRWETPEWEWSRCLEELAGGRGGSVFAMDRVVSKAAAKRELAARLGAEPPAVIDLESAAWAAAAAGRGLPWLVLRAVSDPVEESLPLDFARFTDSAGRVSRSRVLAHAAGRPRLWRSLGRLQRRLAACAEKLADGAERLLAC